MVTATMVVIISSEAIQGPHHAAPGLLRRKSSSHDGEGSPSDLMRWLASPQAEFIQGQVIFVNGGANLSA